MNLSQCVCVVAVLGLLAPISLAQEAKVIGPQSVIETYDAPTVESESGNVLIDFPAMIAAPGVNDELEILAAVGSLNIEFIGAQDIVNKGDFVNFVGESTVGEARTALYQKLREVLLVYRQLPLTIGDLRFIQQDITDVYRELGYPLMAVVVPPQEVVDQAIRIQLNEFSLSDYSVQYANKAGEYSETNEHWSSDKRITAQLDTIKAEPILSQQSLDRAVSNISRNPFRSARVVFEPGVEIGQSRALVQIEEKRLWSLQAGYNDHATESSGRHRYSVGGSFGNLPLEDHQVSWNAVVGKEVDEFQNYSLIYKVPNRWGHTFTANANYSDTASSSIPGIESASTTLQLNLNYDMAFMSGSNYEWTGTVSGASKRFKRASLFGGNEVGGAQFDAVQLALRSTLNVKEANATNQITASITRSFEGYGGDNSLSNFRQFHNSTNGQPNYTFYGLNYARVQQLSVLGERWQGWSTETQASVQFAFDELAGSDNFALGGANILRAYESSEVAGDKGWYLSQMLHAPALPADKFGPLAPVVRQLTVSAFVETGEAKFDRGVKEQIWDFGLQARLSLPKNVACNASFAVAGDVASRTDKNDSRLFIACNWRY